MPIDYYTLLRFLVSVSAGIIFWQHYKSRNNTLLVLYGITVLIFNPIIPIYLMNKFIWIPIDLIAGSLIIYHIFRYSAAEQNTKLK